MLQLMPATVNLDPNEVDSFAELNITDNTLLSLPDTTTDSSETTTSFVSISTVPITTVFEYNFTASTLTVPQRRLTATTAIITTSIASSSSSFVTSKATTTETTAAWRTTNMVRNFTVPVNFTGLPVQVNFTGSVDKNESGNATELDEKNVEDQQDAGNDLLSKNKGAEKFGFPMKSPLNSTSDLDLRHHSQCF